MFGYYINLALRSLRQNVALTALMIIAMGVGIGASMTTLSIFRAMSEDPIPEKSSELFTPQIDNFGPSVLGSFSSALPGDHLPRALTYTDAVALMRAHAAVRQAAMYATSAAVARPDSNELPVWVPARATYRDLFTMFDVPFEFGAPWSAADDAAGAQFVVISRDLNNKLFGGANSVGRTVTLSNEVYRIAGVIQDWDPVPRFYDLSGGDAFGGPEQLYLPFSTAVARDFPRNSTQCLKNPGTGKDAILHSECVWIHFWVQLPDEAAVRTYRMFLAHYATEQRQLGRFNWPDRVALRNVRQWLRYNEVVSSDVSVLLLVAFAFLLVCLLNGSGLMLAKFMARSPQVCIRRALGADSWVIFAQCLVETGMIGLVGGLVGIGLSILGLLVAQGLFVAPLRGPLAASLTQLDTGDVAIAVVLSVGSTLLAGLYPTWRATRVQPAFQLVQ
jgi:putative ABC transport system permease protein